MITFTTKMLDLAKYDQVRLDAERPFDKARYDEIRGREPKKPCRDCGTAEEKVEAGKRHQVLHSAWFRELNDFLKAEADRQKGRTLLYAIRAHGRGRVHLKTTRRCFHLYGLPQKDEFTFDDQAKWIGDRWKQFERLVTDEKAA